MNSLSITETIVDCKDSLYKFFELQEKITGNFKLRMFSQKNNTYFINLLKKYKEAVKCGKFSLNIETQRFLLFLMHDYTM